MKRAVTGGAYRGPVAPTRQRRTIRFVQVLLLLTAAALLVFAGYSFGRVAGYETAQRAGEIDAPREPSLVQPIVLVALASITFGAAVLLQEHSRVRIPTPAKLDELTARAEQAAIDRAEEVARAPRSS